MSEEPLLTVREVQLRLRISRSMAYRLIAENRLAAVRIGTAIRVPSASLRDFIQQNAYKAA